MSRRLHHVAHPYASRPETRFRPFAFEPLEDRTLLSTLFGPTPYLSFAGDSPFAPTLDAGEFSYFHLEDFEDGLANTPGVIFPPGGVARAEVMGNWMDSVKEDFLDDNIGGSIAVGAGLTGWPVTFSFDAAVLGALPTHVGIVLTDLQSDPWWDFTEPVTVEAFGLGPGGVSLGSVTDPNFGTWWTNGETGEDRFLGFINTGGIESITVTSSGPATMELDHLQYGAVVVNQPPVVNDQSFEVDENLTSVGTVAVSDPDAADTISYAISGGADAGLFDIVAVTGELSFLSAPDFETPLDAGGDNVYDVQITVTDGKGASDSANMAVTVTNVTATISGTVFVDADGDGLFDGGTETAIDGVTVELLDSVFALLATDLTELGGVYAFTVDDEFATYVIRETQPTGVDDGAAILGDAGGSVLSSNEMQLTLAGIDASDYDFTEVGQAVEAGDTATIGFWQNKNGRALIEQGGAALVDWLNANFGNILGSTFSDGSGGDDAAEVASFYKDEFFKKKLKGTAKVDAQFMSLALATFFTSSNLSGGSVAAGYGFNVTETGIGTNVVNVGASGAAFDVADNTDMTIMALLLKTNELTGADTDGDASEDYSHVYDTNGDGVLDDAEKALRAMANDVYTLINEGGDI